MQAFKMYSLSLPPIWINDFDDITLHFSFSLYFLSNQMLFKATHLLHYKYTLTQQLKLVTCSHICYFLYVGTYRG